MDIPAKRTRLFVCPFSSPFSLFSFDTRDEEGSKVGFAISVDLFPGVVGLSRRMLTKLEEAGRRGALFVISMSGLGI